MMRTNRAFALGALSGAIAITVACGKKPNTAPTPVSNSGPAASETCNQACRDSIAKAERDKHVADSIAAARAADEARARAAAATATISDKIYFDYDASELSADARGKLDAKIAVMRRNPGLRIRIAGNADERGSDEYNLALGQRRAATAKRYLSDQGIDPTRVETVSYGEQRPALEGHDESAWKMNRRDEFEITSGGENLSGSTP